jgi:charged multivesicular body protein 4A/B
MQALKRKKRLENQLDQLLKTMMTLEDQKTNLENAGMNAEVLDSLKGAGKALKKANKDLDIDKVTSTMDDITEITQLANEITDAISSAVPNADDDELERELEELKNQETNLDINRNQVSLPDVPNDQLPTANKSEVKKALAI